MESNPGNKNQSEIQELNKMSVARKKVATILGYKDAQEMFRIGLANVRLKILEKLRDLKETVDLLEEDESEEKTPEDSYSEEHNIGFRELYQNAAIAKLINPEDMDIIYPPIPEQGKK